MKVQSNDFARQWDAIGDDVLAATRRVGARGHYILGEAVEQFERGLARAWPAAHAVGVASGLDAIEIGLRCLGIHAGDRVLTTPLSAFATTLAILRVQASPVFVDVDSSGLIDLDACARALADDPAIRHFVPVHLYGQSLDLDALAALRDRFELRVVEDCAQSVGATWRGRSTGSVGQMAATSFYPTKNLGALGDGGAVLTDSEPLAVRARTLRNYGQTVQYSHDELGLNSRLDELHAAILHDAMLPKLSAWTAARRRTAARYCAEIANPALQPVASASDSCRHLFPVLVAPADRPRFIAHLRGASVAAGVHYPCLIPDQRAMRGLDGVRTVGDLSNARRFADSEVSLPVHPFLTPDEVSHVIATCNSWSGA